MSSDFFVDRAETWYVKIWIASHGVYSWVLERIAEHTTDPAVAEVLREHADDKAFSLAWYPEFGAEIVRVILGPLRDDLSEESEHVRTLVLELVAMAEGWADATDVFPVFLPWRFTREENGETVRYRSSEEPMREVVFGGVRAADLPPELTHLEIGPVPGGYEVRSARFEAVVAAESLHVLGDPYRGPLVHHSSSG
ncbi:hypothetical protein [Lentzea cavernae]|uniref:Uncharacterized protein n=1 Tax=Lentzea cavernae TaxID=2020703 RepID=A0ABQ3MF76_9PSEU|nr:hypothetical protein [Lentzea cavernae]GHH39179.1 hypothetical protein GCM10017774_30400 [Lentzea cavernae]